MNEPYKKLYRKIGDKKIYIVDGSYIRKNMNGEFTNFAEHYRFPSMIPTNEFWLDECHGHDEYNYYIANMAMENQLMRQGKKWDYANDTACKYEEAMRSKSKPQPLKKELVKSIEGIKIYLVNGEHVRNKYDVNFTQGGHDLVYGYIPDNEIWIDNSLMAKERDEVIFHEMRERNSMSYKVPYIPAHEGASMVERKYRKHGKRALSKPDQEIIS